MAAKSAMDGLAGHVVVVGDHLRRDSTHTRIPAHWHTFTDKSDFRILARAWVRNLFLMHYFIIREL